MSYKVKNINLKIILVFINLMIFSFAANATKSDNFESIIKQANDAYNKKSYDSAAYLYNKVIDQGYESASLYYNLGNTYYRLNDIPSSILYYEKSLEINPRNKNTKFNLSLANDKIQDKVEKMPQFFYVRWFNSFSNLFSINSLAVFSLAFLFLSFVGGFIYFYNRNIKISKLGFFSSLIFIFLFIISISLGFNKKAEINKENKAIIFTPTINIKSSPNDDSKDIFVLHEGTKIILLDKINDWYEIQITDGNKGWIKKENFKII